MTIEPRPDRTEPVKQDQMWKDVVLNERRGVQEWYKLHERDPRAALDADTLNSWIVLLQGEELGFPQELQPDGNFKKKKAFHRTFCSHLNMNVPSNNGIRSWLTCFYDSVIFWDIFLFSVCHQNSTKSLCDSRPVCRAS